MLRSLAYDADGVARGEALKGHRCTDDLTHFLPFLPLDLPSSCTSEGRVELLGGGSLQISNLTEEDAGVYTCAADSGNATVEAQAQLTMQGSLAHPHGVCPLSVGKMAMNWEQGLK